MTVFIKINANNEVIFTHSMPFDEKFGLNKTEVELLQEGYLVDAIPEIEQIEGKEPKLKYVNGEFFIEYEDLPPDEMKILQERLETAEQELATIAYENMMIQVAYEQQIAELWYAVATGGEI